MNTKIKCSSEEQTENKVDYLGITHSIYGFSEISKCNITGRFVEEIREKGQVCIICMMNFLKSQGLQGNNANACVSILV